jgi:DNA or RNA helicases of superfamily II
MADVCVRYDRGTLLVEGPVPEPWPDWLVADARVGRLRAPAVAYRDLIRWLHRAGVAYCDAARAYRTTSWTHLARRRPYPHQTEALQAWLRAGKRGVVVLPTGAGKTYVAELAIERVQRSTLVVVPTLDLMTQWYDRLTTAFGGPVGLVGGGSYTIEDLTVTTYDSAYLHVERLGARFGLVVFDEVHHLPGPAFSQAAEGCIAPFRLGLSATPERPDGAHARLDTLVGPVVHRGSIQQLRGHVLADYDVVTIEVTLDATERAAYEAHRRRFRDFVDARGIVLGAPDGWRRFLQATSRSAEGRAALKAYREQRRLAHWPRAKMRQLEHLLRKHHPERTIVFTHDNASAYAISRALLVPAITHQTPVAERAAILKAFREGTYHVVVTSRVLNEGVDVPAAQVGIVVSGTGSVREHVQRLGRILRREGDKRAILYEIVTADSAEVGQSRRRRRHDAYR